MASRVKYRDVESAQGYLVYELLARRPYSRMREIVAGTSLSRQRTENVVERLLAQRKIIELDHFEGEEDPRAFLVVRGAWPHFRAS